MAEAVAGAQDFESARGQSTGDVRTRSTSTFEAGARCERLVVHGIRPRLRRRCGHDRIGAHRGRGRHRRRDERRPAVARWCRARRSADRTPRWTRTACASPIPPRRRSASRCCPTSGSPCSSPHPAQEMGPSSASHRAGLARRDLGSSRHRLRLHLRDLRVRCRGGAAAPGRASCQPGARHLLPGDRSGARLRATSRPGFDPGRPHVHAGPDQPRHDAGRDPALIADPIGFVRDLAIWPYISVRCASSRRASVSVERETRAARTAGGCASPVLSKEPAHDHAAPRRIRTSAGRALDSGEPHRIAAVAARRAPRRRCAGVAAAPPPRSRGASRWSAGCPGVRRRRPRPARLVRRVAHEPGLPPDPVPDLRWSPRRGAGLRRGVRVPGVVADAPRPRPAGQQRTRRSQRRGRPRPRWQRIEVAAGRERGTLAASDGSTVPDGRGRLVATPSGRLAHRPSPVPRSPVAPTCARSTSAPAGLEPCRMCDADATADGHPRRSCPAYDRGRVSSMLVALTGGTGFVGSAHGRHAHRARAPPAAARAGYRRRPQRVLGGLGVDLADRRPRRRRHDRPGRGRATARRCRGGDPRGRRHRGHRAARRSAGPERRRRRARRRGGRQRSASIRSSTCRPWRCSCLRIGR